MKYNELVENQIVIATIQRELPIVITRHKKTAEYSFYYFNGENFDYVDKNTETELKKIYNSNLGDSFASNTFNNQTFEFKAAYVESTLPICDACLDYFLHIIPQEDQQKCADNANGLKYSFESAKNTSFFVAENRINVAHVYKNKFLLAENLVHENIHCLTKNSKALCCGIIQRTAYATSQSDKIVTAFGEGMNEAITDFFAYEILCHFIKKNNIKTPDSVSFLKQERNLNGYNYIVNIFANIYNQCSNPQQLIKAFVECDMNLFLNHIAKEFHYESHDKILALVYKMDAFLRCHESDSPFAQSDQISIIESMFYDYIDMAKHKAEVENKQIINITDIWNSYRYPDDKSGEFIFEGVKQYFKNATSATNYELNMEETMLACSALVSMASKEKDFSEFKKYITPTLCKHMFSKNMLIFTEDLSTSTTMKQSAFRYMFSQRCELFQKEPQLRLNILSELLDHSSIIEFDFAKFVAAEDFCEVLKQKPYHAAKLYSLNEKKFSEVIEMLDDTTKSQRNFVGNIKNLCELYQQTNKDYRPLMLTYLCSFKDAEIQNRVKDTYFKSLMPSFPNAEQDGPIC